MTNRIARGLAVALGPLLLIQVFGCGVASADNEYVGKTYGDSVKIIGKSATPVIASRVGADLAVDDCIVTRSQNARAATASGVGTAVTKVLFVLNCNASMASATESGNSAASPEFKAAEKAKANEEWARTPDGQAYCQKTEKEHPEWHIMDTVPGCNPEGDQ
jgi:hypothetical protein